MAKRIRGIKFGKCNGCGKKGIISWTSEGEAYIKDFHLEQSILTCYGPYHCCSEECYVKARKDKRKKRRKTND